MGAEDVRGLKRAAAKRLTAGMVAACAVAAVGAPAAMAGTVSNVHTTPPIDPTTQFPAEVAAPAGYTAGPGENNILTLGIAANPNDPNGRDAVFGDSGADAVSGTGVTVSGTTGGFDTTTQEDTCFPDAAVVNWTCPLASKLSVDLGDGDDTVKVPDGLPPLDVQGGTGIDTVDFGPSSAAKTVDLSAGTGDDMTLAGVENVDGGPGGDTITGDADRNVENGGGGNDALTGGGGNDDLSGGPGVNNLNGGAGDDTLTAGNGGDLLDGGAGADTLIGGDGNDTIVAADAAVDTKIDCGPGDDTIVADLGPAGPVDKFVNCENIQGTVRSDPTTLSSGGTVSETVQPVIVVPALGNPPLTQVLAPGKANIADLTPPGASMRLFSRQRIPTVLARGVRVRVTCRESCGISVALSVDRKTARRLRLDSRTSPVIVGTATATRIVAGSTVLRVKLTKKAKVALRFGTRSVIANTQVLVSDASGNGTLLSRHITLVR
jgi:hypothetical protein